MDLPEFLETSFSTYGWSYAHLQRDEWATTMLNSAVAAAEQQILRSSEVEEWSLRLPGWCEGILDNVDPEMDYRGPIPPPWRAGVLYAQALIEAVCDVVPTKAVSADDLIHLRDLLRSISRAVARHVNKQYFRFYWFDPHEGHVLDIAFAGFVEREVQNFVKTEIRAAWDEYRDRLNRDLSSSPIQKTDSQRKADERARVVTPLLAAKGWSVNRWGTTEAGVGKNCAYEYLRGERDLSVENRAALAQALGISAEELPND